MITYIVYGIQHQLHAPEENCFIHKQSKHLHTIEEAEAWKAQNDAEQKDYIKRYHLPDWFYEPAFIVVRGTIGELVEKFPNAEIKLFNRFSTFQRLLNTPAEYTPSIGRYKKGVIEPLE